MLGVNCSAVRTWDALFRRIPGLTQLMEERLYDVSLWLILFGTLEWGTVK